MYVVDDEAIRPPNWGTIAGLGGLLLVAGIVLWAMGRPLVCECGTIKLWHGNVYDPQVSQHLTDWYTLTHVSHGILLYGAIQWLFPERSFGWTLLVATGLEVGWEIVENTPYVIDYYRQNTMAVVYTGDTILNSLADIGAMIAGAWAATRLPLVGSVGLLLVTELLLIILIRDSLTLNILMFLAPLESLKEWQMAPFRNTLFLLGMTIR